MNPKSHPKTHKPTHTHRIYLVVPFHIQTSVHLICEQLAAMNSPIITQFKKKYQLHLLWETEIQTRNIRWVDCRCHTFYKLLWIAREYMKFIYMQTKLSRFFIMFKIFHENEWEIFLLVYWVEWMRWTTWLLVGVDW